MKTDGEKLAVAYEFCENCKQKKHCNHGRGEPLESADCDNHCWVWRALKKQEF